MQGMLPGAGVLLLALFACGRVETSRPSGSTGAAGATSPAPSLHARLTTRSSDGIRETRFTIDLLAGKVVSEVKAELPFDPEAERTSSGAAQKERDSEAFERIVERFEQRPGRAASDGELFDALSGIRRWAELRRSTIGFSPDGKHVAATVDDEPLVLLEVETLEGGLLAPAHDSIPQPFAWSPDSRRIAFAMQATRELFVYDVVQRAIVTKKTNTGPWVASLSWSPDGQRIASFELHDRRRSNTPLGMIGAAAGHPDYRNDGVLTVHHVGDQRRTSLVLARDLSEMSSPRIELEWK